MIVYGIIFGVIFLCGVVVGWNSNSASDNTSTSINDPDIKKIRDIEQFRFYKDLTYDGKREG